MATRSNIAVYDNENKTLTQVYCHYDGYIDGVGKTLLENYNSLKKAKKLVSFGSISSIKKTIKSSKFFNRDFMEDMNFLIKDLKVQNDEDVFKLSEGSESYCYLWFKGEWYTKDENEYKKLTDYLI